MEGVIQDGKLLAVIARLPFEWDSGAIEGGSGIAPISRSMWGARDDTKSGNSEREVGIGEESGMVGDSKENRI
jgi:hypothetical protein